MGLGGFGGFLGKLGKLLWVWVKLGGFVGGWVGLCRIGRALENLCEFGVF